MSSEFLRTRFLGADSGQKTHRHKSCLRSVRENTKLCHALPLKWTAELIGEDITAINELWGLTMFPEEATLMMGLLGPSMSMPPQDEHIRQSTATQRIYQNCDRAVWSHL
ncbi:hypothetical protein PENNAL_c0039G11584 [Penicillium nalgiovense]|uniref:Uncharacterized protein n=1 Tax=Penicillium nalgiovense TaxID=60175 RepID=A0A1V6Y2V9_PENNA|nr:hypothetical protein PENNAL_c0039G11584 [Penicillium nalgiovense]